jgi:hypothetical protein
LECGEDRRFGIFFLAQGRVKNTKAAILAALQIEIAHYRFAKR